MKASFPNRRHILSRANTILLYEVKASRLISAHKRWATKPSEDIMDHHGAASARPISWKSGTFNPLSKEYRSFSTMDVDIPPNFTCSYCRSLIEDVDYPLHAPKSETWYSEREFSILFNQRSVPYLEIVRFVRNGCHVCTIIICNISISGREELEDIAVKTELHTITSRTKNFRFFIRFSVSSKAEPSFTKSTVIKISKPKSDPQFKGPLQSIFTVSQECLDLGHTWMQQCLGKHPNCPPFEAKWVLTRLIKVFDVSKVQLVDTTFFEMLVSYYALSYCRGKESVLTMTRALLETFKISIPFKDFPYTIQDTIQVVYRMGGNYIWVDSICIIQDDLEDWKREATTMCDVYQNVLLTTVTLGASGATEGLFGRRDPLAAKGCSIQSIIFLGESIWVDWGS
ncbi:hypothetical protein G7Y89_g14739 [Cudoniella acicularis]|uniref:Heterokaryon incompatibility domain-containing protein n=1 Tax=Cudoniella acicularis TaxID=354080 RepID=A0A8H4VTU5_9HELO|nr:hypothetical protein G7Y89_g14739 [Cudoniella acicularis]